MHRIHREKHVGLLSPRTLTVASTLLLLGSVMSALMRDAAVMTQRASIVSNEPGFDGLGFDEIVFVKRKPYSSDHYYTDINNGTSPDRFLPDKRYLHPQPPHPSRSGRS